MKFFCVTIFDFYVDVLLVFFFYIVLEKTSVSAAEFYHMTYDASLFWCIFSFFSVVDMGCVHLILSNYSNFLSNKKKTTIETVFEHIYC